jgi:hypothetical protein
MAGGNVSLKINHNISPISELKHCKLCHRSISVHLTVKKAISLVNKIGSEGTDLSVCEGSSGGFL